MSEKRFTGKLLTNRNGEEFGFTIYDEDKRMNIDEVVDCLNEQQATIRRLQDLCGESDSENTKLRIENEQLKEKVKKLGELATRTEEEKEHFADLYNECRRLKLSDEAIKQAYADLNRREREKHSQGNATYTAKCQTEVIY